MKFHKTLKRVSNPTKNMVYDTIGELSNNKYGIKISLINYHQDKGRLKFIASMYIKKSYLLEIDLYKRELENINKNQPDDINTYYILPGQSFLSKEVKKLPFRFRLPVKIESVYTDYKIIDRKVYRKNISVLGNGILLNKNTKLPDPEDFNFLSDVVTSNNGAKKVSNNLTNEKKLVRLLSSRGDNGDLLTDYLCIHLSMNVLPFSKISDFYTEALEFRKAVMSFITKTLYDIKFETKLDIEKSKIWYSFMSLRNGKMEDIQKK